MARKAFSWLTCPKCPRTMCPMNEINQVMGLIKRKARRVIGKFESSCGHSGAVQQACNEEQELYEMIRGAIEAAEKRGRAEGQVVYGGVA